MSKLIFNHPQVENVAPLALKPNPDNPKLHNRKQRRAIEASIRRFGFIVPIVIDDQNRIVAGHGRWEAAKEAGLDEVPVIRVKFMSDADRRAFALAENRLSEMGGWDDALLKKELGALFDQGYDLEITGFSTADLDLSIEVDTSATTEEVIQVPTDCWVSRPGDLWTVGPHRLLCGNSLDPNDVERVLGGELAAMVFSDPPYGVRVNGHVSGTGRFAEFQMMSGEQTSAELTQIGNVCKAVAIDSHTVMDIFCQDTKLNLSSYYLKPGFAFGGSCLPKDVRALTHKAKTLDLDLPILNAILPSNALQVERGYAMVTRKGKRRIGVLGFSFKAGTDDLRESPTVELIERLIGKGYDLRLYDRNVSLAALTGANRDYILNHIPHISRIMASSIDEVLAYAEVVMIGNGAQEFQQAIERLRPDQQVVDLVRIKARPADDKQYDGICW